MIVGNKWWGQGDKRTLTSNDIKKIKSCQQRNWRGLNEVSFIIGGFRHQSSNDKSRKGTKKSEFDSRDDEKLAHCNVFSLP